MVRVNKPEQERVNRLRARKLRGTHPKHHVTRAKSFENPSDFLNTLNKLFGCLFLRHECNLYSAPLYLGTNCTDQGQLGRFRLGGGTLKLHVAAGCCVVYAAVGGMACAQPSLHLGLSPPARAPASEFVAFSQIPIVPAFLNFFLGNQKSGDKASGDNDVSSETGFGTPQASSILPKGRKPVVPLPRAFPSVATAAVASGAAPRRNAIGMKPTSANPVALLPQVREFDPGKSSQNWDQVSVTAVAMIESTLPKPRPEKIRKFRSIENLRILVETASRLPDAASITDHDEWSCLTEAIYFEARGESLRGQVAVAEVILNRRNSPEFPGTICEVLDQGVHKRGKCQFSYNCDGLHEVFHEEDAHRKAALIASKMLEGFELNLTNGALYYHSVSVRPGWSKKLIRTARIGDHYFFNRRDA